MEMKADSGQLRPYKSTIISTKQVRIAAKPHRDNFRLLREILDIETNSGDTLNK